MRPVPEADAEPRPEYDPLIGIKIADKYLVKRRLATGRLSIIYLVETDEKEACALHILTERFVETQERQRFEREVEILVQVDHNRIINPLDLGLHNYRPFFVTEYCEYGTLDAYWQENHAHLNQKYVLEILDQLGDALQYLHSVGIIHCDVNPQNILLRTPTDIVLTDFSLARQLYAAPTPNAEENPSTPWYMAPEQWLHEPVTPATDQYALAVLAYLLFTGRHPIDGDPQFIRMVYESSTDYQPQALSSLNRYLSGAIDDVVLKALSHKPSNRYESVSAFLGALERALGDEDAEPRGAKPQRRTPFPTVILGLVILAIIVLGIGLSDIASGLSNLTTTVATPSPIVQVAPTSVRSETPEPIPTGTSTPTIGPPTATVTATIDVQLLVAQSLTSIVLSASPTSMPSETSTSSPTVTASLTSIPSATPGATATPLPSLVETLAKLLPGTPNRFDCATYRMTYEFLVDAVARGEPTYVAAASLFSFDDSTASLIYGACGATGSTQFTRIDSSLYADLRFEIDQLIALNGLN